MKLTKGQLDELKESWKRSNKGWDELLMEYDFSLPDHGWKNWDECPPTEEEGDCDGSVIAFIGYAFPYPTIMPFSAARRPRGSQVFWTRTPNWKPKPKDPFEAFLEKIPDNFKSDETSMSVIKSAYKLGQSNPHESQPS